MIDGVRRNMCADVESNNVPYIRQTYISIHYFVIYPAILNICVYQYPSSIHQICQQGDNYYKLIHDQFRFADKAIYTFSIVSEVFVIACVSSNVITW